MRTKGERAGVEVFECRGCGTALTGPLSRVPFPVYAGIPYGNGVAMPVLMESGTYALGIDLFDPADEGENEGSVLLAPGDAAGTRLIPGRNEGNCCGLDGYGGPNLACAGCGRPVAARIDECSAWQATWLEPDAARRVPAGPPRPVADWASVAGRWRAAALVEADGSRSIRWDVEAAVTLAHLVSAADGAPLALAPGPLAQAFRGLLGQLPPPQARPARRAALAGPGRPLPRPLPDIAVVPRHPQTGEPWPTPPGVAAAPLAAEYWAALAFHDERELAPATGRLPPGVERDDPLPPHPLYAGYLDRWVFRAVLNRLNGVDDTQDDHR
ncbi:hypothetical protein AB0F92_38395 [Kitasatospora aureofaciens]|uniref:hypothetical protein n=1 Tax=Kitasatospora aureofaciens TaxID=1894 RepID=UPI0033E23E08